MDSLSNEEMRQISYLSDAYPLVSMNIEFLASSTAALPSPTLTRPLPLHQEQR
ncbi:hypothetical protein QJS10_CPA08g00047 [Acorus calamus]|uniref:Uncharacterized protein n=1 Tax=Acorus calamus TaxID=4465 RepID=A0AAV9EFP6_ACOCL|nr:hypothetical protein QJS10_CPA08g00047 [Acorus calamus]